MWDLSSPPGIKPKPSVLEVQSLNHWTTSEVPFDTLEPQRGLWRAQAVSYLWSGLQIPGGPQNRKFLPEAVWCSCCSNRTQDNFLLRPMPGHQPRVSKALKWLLAELPRARQNRFLSTGHGHSCQSVGAPTSPPGGPPGASPQWRVLGWLRDCLPTCGNKPHRKPLFKEQASGLVFKPLETLDKSLLCFYLHVNSQIGTFQEKTSTSFIIRLGYKDGACPSLYTLKTTKINGFIRLVISLCHSMSMVLKSGSLNQVQGHHLGTWAHTDPQRRGCDVCSSSRRCRWAGCRQDLCPRQWSQRSPTPASFPIACGGASQVPVSCSPRGPEPRNPRCNWGVQIRN